jgi:hypothetical protein
MLRCCCLVVCLWLVIHVLLLDCSCAFTACGITKSSASFLFRWTSNRDLVLRSGQIQSPISTIATTTSAEDTSPSSRASQQQQLQQQPPSESSLLGPSSSPSSPPSLPTIATNEILRNELVDLLSYLVASNRTQIQRVEDLINTLEGRYTNPILTVDFFETIAIDPSWQLILSTSQLTTAVSQQNSTVVGAGGVSPRQFRLRGLTQQGNSTAKSLTTMAMWEYSEYANGIFDCSGSFAICSLYRMTPQSTRMDQFQMANQPVLRLQKGSKLPSDVPRIVQLLHRSMPAELLDMMTIHNVIVDTTYVDAVMKIVRYSGPNQMEGIRNVFVRNKASTATATTSSSSLL